MIMFIKLLLAILTNKKFCLHVGTISHKYGTNFYIEPTEDRLYAKLFKFVKEYWHEIDSDESPENMDDREAINHYFELHHSETLDIGNEVLSAREFVKNFVGQVDAAGIE